MNKPKSKSKTLYYIGSGDIYGNLFFDKNGPIAYIHENDGDWRDEYYNFIPRYFGGRVEQIYFDMPDQMIEKLGEADCMEKYWEILGPTLLKIVNSIKE